MHWHFLEVGWLPLWPPAPTWSWVIASPLASLSSKDVREPKYQGRRFVTLPHSLSDVLTSCGTSGLIKLSSWGILVTATYGSGKIFRRALFKSLFVHASLTKDFIFSDTAARLVVVGCFSLSYLPRLAPHCSQGYRQWEPHPIPWTTMRFFPCPLAQCLSHSGFFLYTSNLLPHRSPIIRIATCFSLRTWWNASTMYNKVSLFKISFLAGCMRLPHGLGSALRLCMESGVMPVWTLTFFIFLSAPWGCLHPHVKCEVVRQLFD